MTQPLNQSKEQEFRDWACSFSGCDGGDPNAPIWLSGIEWGFGKERGQSDEEYEVALREYYTQKLPEEISSGAVKFQDKYVWNEHNKYRFGQSLAKLYLAINGLSIDHYAKIDQLAEDHSLFKLNLYPIPFRYADDSLWEKYDIAKVTGMESKETYRTWCFLNRFPAISDLVTRHNPKMIIGMGVTYLTDFFACFAGTFGSDKIHVETVDASATTNKKVRRFYWSRINEGRTLLAVLPFFTGAYGLNSNYLITAVGSRLGELRQHTIGALDN